MANKIATALSGMKTAFTAMVDGDGLPLWKEVSLSAAFLNPMLRQVKLPALVIVAGDVSQIGGPRAARQWEATYVLEVITAAVGQSCAADITDLIARLEAAIDALAVGCVVWQPSYILQQHIGESVVAVWAMGTGKLEITGPLLTA